jgi:hypothetical protein
MNRDLAGIQTEGPTLAAPSMTAAPACPKEPTRAPQTLLAADAFEPAIPPFVPRRVGVQAAVAALASAAVIVYHFARF